MTKFWDDLKMWLLFPCKFSQLFPPQNAAPSTRHGVCSTAHQRRLAELPQALPAHERQVVHRDERPAVLGAQQALFGRPGLGAAAAPPRRRRRGPPAPGRASAVERHGSRKVPTAFVERGHSF